MDMEVIIRLISSGAGSGELMRADKISNDQKNRR